MAAVESRGALLTERIERVKLILSRVAEPGIKQLYAKFGEVTAYSAAAGEDPAPIVGAVVAEVAASAAVAAGDPVPDEVAEARMRFPGVDGFDWDKPEHILWFILKCDGYHDFCDKDRAGPLAWEIYLNAMVSDGPEGLRGKTVSQIFKLFGVKTTDIEGEMLRVLKLCCPNLGGRTELLVNLVPYYTPSLPRPLPSHFNIPKENKALFQEVVSLFNGGGNPNASLYCADGTPDLADSFVDKRTAVLTTRSVKADSATGTDPGTGDTPPYTKGTPPTRHKFTTNNLTSSAEVEMSFDNTGFEGYPNVFKVVARTSAGETYETFKADNSSGPSLGFLGRLMVDKQLQALVKSTIPSKDGRIRAYIESLGVRATATELRLAEIIRACVYAEIPIEKIAADLKTFGDAEIVKEAINLDLTMVGTRDGQEFIQAALGKLLALYAHQVDGQKTVSVIMPPRGTDEQIALQSAQRNYSTVMHKFNEFVKACKGFQTAAVNYRTNYASVFNETPKIADGDNAILLFAKFLIKSYASSLQEELSEISKKLGKLPEFDYREADITDITGKPTDEVNADVTRLNAAIASTNMGHYLRTAKILKTAKTDHVERLKHLIVNIQTEGNNYDFTRALEQLTAVGTNKRQYSQHVNTLVNEDFAKKVLETSSALPGVLKTLAGVKKEALKQVSGVNIASEIVRLFGEAIGKVPLSDGEGDPVSAAAMGGGDRVQYGGAALGDAEAAFNAAFATLNAIPVPDVQEGVEPDFSEYDNAYIATEIAGHAVSEQLYALDEELEKEERSVDLLFVEDFMHKVVFITKDFLPLAAGVNLSNVVSVPSVPVSIEEESPAAAAPTGIETPAPLSREQIKKIIALREAAALKKAAKTSRETTARIKPESRKGEFKRTADEGLTSLEKRDRASKTSKIRRNADLELKRMPIPSLGGGTRKSKRVCSSCGYHQSKHWKTQRKPRRRDDEHQVEVEIVAL